VNLACKTLQKLQYRWRHFYGVVKTEINPIDGFYFAMHTPLSPSHRLSFYTVLGLTLGLAVLTSAVGAQTPPDSVHLPEGTLGPVTLKASLQQTQTLPVNLQDVLNLALGKSIVVQQAQTQEKKARLSLKQTWAELLPDVTVQYNQSRFVGVFQIFGGDNLDISRTTYQPQISANYTLYPGGKNLWEIKASKQRAQAQENLTEAARQEALLAVSNAYYGLQQAYWQKAITLQALEETQKRVDLTEARFNNGVGLKLDWLQAKTELANRKADLLTAESSIISASQTLAQLLDMDLAVNLVPKDLDAGPSPVVDPSATFLGVKTLQQQVHPTLLAFKKLKEAAHTDVTVSVSDLVPKIDLNTYFNGTGPALDRMGISKFGGFQVSTNLLENMGFAKPLQIRQAKASAKSADLSFRDTARQLEQALVEDWTDAEALRQKMTLAREGLESSKMAFEQAYGRLQEGVGTSLDVDNAQTRLTQARQNVAKAFLDFNQGQIQLLKTLGILSIDTLTQGNPQYGLRPLFSNP